jgi:hypothetical protein
MMKRLLVIAVLLMGVAGYAYASDTASQPQVSSLDSGWVSQDLRSTVLLIETTSVALDQALTELGAAFDVYAGDDFSAVNLAPYTDVFVAMDGGLVVDASIVNVANWCAAGGHLHFYGGTCWYDYAVAMNTHLVQNNFNDYCWTQVAAEASCLQHAEPESIARGESDVGRDQGPLSVAAWNNPESSL